MFQMQTRENIEENFKNPKTLRVPARIRGSHAGALWVWMRNQHKMNMKYWLTLQLAQIRQRFHEILYI